MVSVLQTRNALEMEIHRYFQVGFKIQSYANRVHFFLFRLFNILLNKLKKLTSIAERVVLLLFPLITRSRISFETRYGVLRSSVCLEGTTKIYRAARIRIEVLYTGP